MGYEAVAPIDFEASDDPVLMAEVLETALRAVATMPPETFMSIRVPAHLVTEVEVTATISRPRPMFGITLDITDPAPGTEDAVAVAVSVARSNGAMISLAGIDGGQPGLRSITRIRPDIIRLGRAWIDGIDTSEPKRSAMSHTGALASQLNAWIWVEDVRTDAELLVLRDLEIPLACGPIIGDVRTAWADASRTARDALSDSDDARRSGTMTLRNVAQPITLITEDMLDVGLRSPGQHGIVIVDEQNRPESVIERDIDGTWMRTPAFVLSADTHIEDAAIRAMARPRNRRYAPLVCLDNNGAPLGLVSIDRLVKRLASHC